MSRSLKKGPYICKKLLKKVLGWKSLPDKEREKAVIKTYARASTITPEMVGVPLGVHNGKTFIVFSVREEMVGHRLGEFAPTRKFVRHGGKLQREIEAKQTAK